MKMKVSVSEMAVIEEYFIQGYTYLQFHFSDYQIISNHCNIWNGQAPYFIVCYVSMIRDLTLRS